MKTLKYPVVIFATLITLLLLIVATSVDARERGDRTYPTDRNPVEEPTTPPADQDDDATDEPSPSPVIVPLELLLRWEAMTINGQLEQVQAEFRAFVEDGINPLDSEEQDSQDPPVVNEDEDNEESNEEVCTETEVEVTDRVRDRSISRTRAGQTTTVIVCEPGTGEEEPVEDEEEPSEEEEDDMPVSYIGAVASEILRLTNIERENEGLDVLVYDGMLTYLGTVHSEWMLETRIFSHDRIDPAPDGAGQVTYCNLGCRLGEVVYPVTAWGENIAWRSGSLQGANDLAATLMNGWMNSSSHRANILSDNFTIIGVGLAQAGDTVFATQEFARN